jgi:hypothetical protein
MEKEPKIPQGDLKKRMGKIETEKAVEGLEEAFEKSDDLSEEEREKELFSIPGVEKGKDWDKMQEHLREKREKKD